MSTALSLSFALMIGLGVVSAFALIVTALKRYPVLGVAFVAISLLTLWEAPNPPALVTVSGLQIYLNDVGGLVMAVVAFLNLRNLNKRLKRSVLAWALLGGLIAFSLLRGALDFGIGQAFNEARVLLWSYFALSWALSVRWQHIDGRRALIAIGWCLTAVAGYHAAVYGVGDASSRIEVGSIERTGRLLVATQALALGLCAMLLLLRIPRDRLARLSGVVFAVVAVVSQHRSVWAAIAIGLAAVMMFSRGWTSRVRAWGLVASGGLTLLLLAASGMFGGLLESIATSATDSRTFNARSASWTQLIVQLFEQGPLAVLFGLPFGWGFTRVEPNGLMQTYQPHNWYALLMLRSGLLGVAAWCVVLFRGIVISRRQNTQAFFTLAAVATFGWFYSVPWQIALWIGLAFSPNEKFEAAYRRGARRRFSHRGSSAQSSRRTIQPNV